MHDSHTDPETVAGLETDADVESRVRRRLHALERTVGTVPAGARILDLGCGGGDTVSSLLTRGFDAYGCDLRFRHGLNRERLETTGRILLIDAENYRLPFDDASFDLVLSDQVLEHVQDYPETLNELRRVTRPGGIGFHVFPARWRPIEVHVKIPFGGVVHHPAWLRLWAALGVRNVHQESLSANEVVARNVKYLTSNVNYLGAGELRRAFEAAFDEVRFVESVFLEESARGRRLMQRPGMRKFLPLLYHVFWMKVVLLRRSEAS